MLKSDFKNRLKNGEKLFGTFVKLNCPSVVEMLGIKGFDFIIIDKEHSAFSPTDLEKMLMAADVNDLPVIVRTPNSSEEHILHALDGGAYGVQIPNITDASEVKGIVDAAKYYPLGKRGLSFAQRAAGFGMCGGDEYIKASNQNSVISIHIENITMANKVSDLCEIPEIDVLFVGPADLSQSMGKPGQTDDPEVAEVIKRVFAIAISKGKKIGIYVGTEAAIEKYSKMGATYFAWKSDVLLMAEGINRSEEIFEKL